MSYKPDITMLKHNIFCTINKIIHVTIQQNSTYKVKSYRYKKTNFLFIKLIRFYISNVTIQPMKCIHNLNSLSKLKNNLLSSFTIAMFLIIFLRTKSYSVEEKRLSSNPCLYEYIMTLLIEVPNTSKTITKKKRVPKMFREKSSDF